MFNATLGSILDSQLIWEYFQVSACKMEPQCGLILIKPPTRHPSTTHSTSFSNRFTVWCPLSPPSYGQALFQMASPVLVELRLVLSLIITTHKQPPTFTHPPPLTPRESRDAASNWPYCQAQFQLASPVLVELRLVLSLIITTPTHPGKRCSSKLAIFGQ